jgi:hypothetical protein
MRQQMLIIVTLFSASARADVVTYWNEVATNAIVRGGKSPGIHLAMVQRRFMTR